MHHTRIIVCGGGNIAHSLVAAIARHEEVDVLTRQPGRWSHSVNDSPHRVCATDDVAGVATAEVVLVAVPQFAVESQFARMRPYLKPGQLVCFVPANSLMPTLCDEAKSIGVDIACFQRVPYIARIREYGKLVAMSAPRTNHRVFLSSEAPRGVLDDLCRRIFEAPANYLRSPLTFVFNNQIRFCIRHEWWSFSVIGEIVFIPRIRFSMRSGQMSRLNGTLRQIGRCSRFCRLRNRRVPAQLTMKMS